MGRIRPQIAEIYRSQQCRCVRRAFTSLWRLGPPLGALVNGAEKNGPEPLGSVLAGVRQLQHRLGAVEVGLRTQLTLLSADRDRLRSLTLVRWVREGLFYI